MKASKQLLAALVGASLTIGSTQLLADPPQGGGDGPGIMGGGHGHGMGSGMMGLGMMGGHGRGYGMGPGMMGGWGPGYGMGSGMMGGYGAGPGFDLNLTEEQRGKIAKIQDEVRRKQWELMGKIHDEQRQMNEQYRSDDRDDAALSKSYRKMSDLRQQMFDLSLSAEKQIDAALTKEQRDKLKRGGCGMLGALTGTAGGSVNAAVPASYGDV